MTLENADRKGLAIENGNVNYDDSNCLGYGVPP